MKSKKSNTLMALVVATAITSIMPASKALAEEETVDLSENTSISETESTDEISANNPEVTDKDGKKDTKNEKLVLTSDDGKAIEEKNNDLTGTDNKVNENEYISKEKDIPKEDEGNTPTTEEKTGETASDHASDEKEETANEYVSDESKEDEGNTSTEEENTEEINSDLKANEKDEAVDKKEITVTIDEDPFDLNFNFMFDALKQYYEHDDVDIKSEEVFADIVIYGDIGESFYQSSVKVYLDSSLDLSDAMKELIDPNLSDDEFEVKKKEINEKIEKINPYDYESNKRFYLDCLEDIRMQKPRVVAIKSINSEISQKLKYLDTSPYGVSFILSNDFVEPIAFTDYYGLFIYASPDDFQKFRGQMNNLFSPYRKRTLTGIDAILYFNNNVVLNRGSLEKLLGEYARKDRSRYLDIAMMKLDKEYFDTFYYNTLPIEEFSNVYNSVFENGNPIDLITFRKGGVKGEDEEDLIGGIQYSGLYLATNVNPKIYKANPDLAFREVKTDVKNRILKFIDDDLLKQDLLKSINDRYQEIYGDKYQEKDEYKEKIANIDKLVLEYKKDAIYAYQADENYDIDFEAQKYKAALGESWGIGYPEAQVGNVDKKTEEIDFGTKYEYDANLEEGKTVILTPGVKGKKVTKITYKVDPANGELSDPVEEIVENVSPIDQVIRIGTKKVSEKISIPWTDIEDIAKPIEKEDDNKVIPWTDIEDIAKPIEKEDNNEQISWTAIEDIAEPSNKDEKAPASPANDDKNDNTRDDESKDNIVDKNELSPKDDKKEDRKVSLKKAYKKSSTNPKTGVTSITSLLGTLTLLSGALLKRKKDE
ncbi:MAG: G5 domain-containing protein [Peptoniphilaceae bacterium]|nr:G5 domain-containing protein [Peptoniphilaceae bacterium]MDY6018776.1 G5 domain-containing protein [Anaerococcus sp.]